MAASITQRFDRYFLVLYSMLDKAQCKAYTRAMEQFPLFSTVPGPDRVEWYGFTRPERIQSFRELECDVPADEYHRLLTDHGVSSPGEFRKMGVAWACYEKLWYMAQEYRLLEADPTTYENYLAQEGLVDVA